MGLARPGTGECAWASERREGKDVQGLRGCLRRAGRHRGCGGLDVGCGVHYQPGMIGMMHFMDYVKYEYVGRPR